MKLWIWALAPPLAIALVAGLLVLVGRPVKEHQVARSPSEHFVAEAMRAAERGDNELAIQKFSQAIELEPNDHHAIWRRAMTRMNLQDFAGALVDLNRALALAMHPYYLQSRGQILFMQKRYDEAIADLREASAMDPTNVIAWQLQADALATQGKYAEAIEPYSQAIKAGKPTAVLYQARGNAFANAGQHEQAIADYTQALEFDPANVALYQTRANALTAAGKLTEALADYDQLTKLEPGNPAHQDGRAITLQRIAAASLSPSPSSTR